MKIGLTEPFKSWDYGFGGRYRGYKLMFMEELIMRFHLLVTPRSSRTGYLLNPRCAIQHQNAEMKKPHPLVIWYDTWTLRFRHYVICEMQWRMAFAYGGHTGMYTYKGGNHLVLGFYFLERPHNQQVPG